MSKEIPFEASYEKAKTEIINFIGKISQVYDIPPTLLTTLVYEIALESKVSAMSVLLAGCNIEYPEATDMGDISNKPHTETFTKDELPQKLKEYGVAYNKGEPDITSEAV